MGAWNVYPVGTRRNELVVSIRLLAEVFLTTTVGHGATRLRGLGKSHTQASAGRAMWGGEPSRSGGSRCSTIVATERPDDATMSANYSGWMDMTDSRRPNSLRVAQFGARPVRATALPHQTQLALTIAAAERLALLTQCRDRVRNAWWYSAA